MRPLSESALAAAFTSSTMASPFLFIAKEEFINQQYQNRVGIGKHKSLVDTGADDTNWNNQPFPLLLQQQYDTNQHENEKI